MTLPANFLKPWSRPFKPLNLAADRSRLEALTRVARQETPQKPVSYTVVEQAGYEGERDIKTFNTAKQANDFIVRQYYKGEVEEMHVAVRREWHDGRKEY